MWDDLAEMEKGRLRMNDEMRPELKVWFPVFRVTTESSWG